MADRFRTTIVAIVALALPLMALAQQPTTGTLRGVVGDRDGKALPGATVVVIGPLGERGVQTDAGGNFEVRFLPTGTYRVRCELASYATIEIPEVVINSGQRTNLPITLLPGQEEQVNVSATPLIDARRTDLAANYNAKETVETLPVGRNFTDVVAFTAGVVDGGATGNGNFSVGGSSGLENSYIIDGVNITDSGYGGVGSYSVVYGSLGTGITSQFLEEVQVKTGGFEAEYGQALGGVVAGTIRTGTNDLAGSLSAFVSPASLQAHGKDVELSTGAFNVHEQKISDFGVSAGGAIVKDKLFWYAGFNPVTNSTQTFATRTVNPILEFDPGTAATYPDRIAFGSAGVGREVERKNKNYVAKLNWSATPNHRFELTAFGDPSSGDGRSGANAGAFVMNGNVDTNGDLLGDTPIAKIAAFGGDARRSRIDFGADQQSVNYNGLVGGDWFLEGRVNHRKNDYQENSLINDYQYTDNRVLREQVFSFPQTIRSSVAPTSGGAGFISPRQDETYDYSFKVSKSWGSHEVKFGAQYFDLSYDQPNVYSGPQTTVYYPREGGGPPVGVRSSSGALVQVRNGIPGCSLCGFSAGNPQYRTTRIRFNPPKGTTSGNEIAFFAQDTWSIGEKWVLKYGVRSSSQKLEGAEKFSLPLTQITHSDGTVAYTEDMHTYNPNSFTFKTELSPRLGVSFDPQANGKSKLYANYARYYERVPADLAVRQFSNEVNSTTARFRDPLLTTPNLGIVPTLGGYNPGVVCGQKSQERRSGLLNGECTGASRLPYVDEFVAGWQQQIRPDLTVEVRGIYRDQGRVLEDVQFTTLESTQNLYYGIDANGNGQIDYNSNTEVPFPGYQPKAFGAYVLANPGENTKGNFGQPERLYRALEMILNKTLSNHWAFQANYRYSRLTGNYEGLFRNDNGQSDPNISSLFDFPNSPLLRGQFQSGPLNTDRPHVLNLLGTYFFDSGFEVGGILRWQSGQPRTPLLAHPSYQNAGEVPGVDPVYASYTGDSDNDGNPDHWVIGQRVGGPGEFILGNYTDCPRGCLGRTPDFASLDLHLGYSRSIKDTRLKIQLDVRNLFDTQEANAFNDFVEVTAGAPNPVFNQILAYQAPRDVRFGVTWDF